jgi:hypothetical protein
MRSTFNLTLLALAVSALTACGGGGSSTPSAPVGNSPVGNTPVSNPPVAGPTSFVVGLNRVGFTNHDVLVSTTAKAQAASGRAGILSARRADLPTLQGQDLGFTNMVRDGLLSGLGTSLTAEDGSVIPCDLTSVDITIGTIYTMNSATGDMIATISAPGRIDLVTKKAVGDTPASTTCVPTYEQHDYVITGAGQVIKADQLRIFQIVDVLPAHEAAFNTSDSAVLYYNDMMFRTLDVSTAGVKLLDLSSMNAPILTILGRMAYDGTYLIGQSAYTPTGFFMTNGGLIVYKRGETKFATIDANYNKNYGLFIGADNKFYLNEGQTGDPEFNGMHRLDVDGVWANTSNGRGTLFSPPELQIPDTGWDYSITDYQPLPTAAQLAGRVGDWVVGHTCQPWNMRTGQVKQVLTQPLYREPSYARVIDGQLLCASTDMTEFVRRDLTSGVETRFNLSSAYMVRTFKMYANQAMVEVLEKATGDRKYINLNFATNVMSDLGTISGDTRQVVDLLPTGN